jgi:hypothetical protein
MPVAGSAGTVRELELIMRLGSLKEIILRGTLSRMKRPGEPGDFRASRNPGRSRSAPIRRTDPQRGLAARHPLKAHITQRQAPA